MSRDTHSKPTTRLYHGPDRFRIEVATTTDTSESCFVLLTEQNTAPERTERTGHVTHSVTPSDPPPLPTPREIRLPSSAREPTHPRPFSLTVSPLTLSLPETFFLGPKCFYLDMRPHPCFEFYGKQTRPLLVLLPLYFLDVRKY